MTDALETDELIGARLELFDETALIEAATDDTDEGTGAKEDAKDAEEDTKDVEEGAGL